MKKEEIKSRIKLWIPHVQRLAEDYAFYMNSELHPVHKGLIEDMREVMCEKVHTRKK